MATGFHPGPVGGLAVPNSPKTGDVEDGTGPERIPPDRIDPTGFARPVGLPIPVRPIGRGPIGMDSLSDTVLDELAADAVGWPGRTAVSSGPIARPAPSPEPGGGLTKLAATLIVAGSRGYLARSGGGARSTRRKAAPLGGDEDCLTSAAIGGSREAPTGFCSRGHRPRFRAAAPAASPFRFPGRSR